jgi:Pectate lyase superfamily protein
MSITKATSNVIAPILATGSTTARSLPDRFADIVNVLDYGAVGDGVTDDTVAIQAAEASSYNRVYVPQGIYKTSYTSINQLSKIYFGEGQIVINGYAQALELSSTTTIQPIPSTNRYQQFANLAEVPNTYFKSVTSGANPATIPTVYTNYYEWAQNIGVYDFTGGYNNSISSMSNGRSGAFGTVEQFYHGGQGDLVGKTFYGDVYSNKSGATHFLANPALVVENGTLGVTSPNGAGCYLNHSEYIFSDNGYAIACIDRVRNYFRTNSGSSLSQVWIHDRPQSGGSQPIDSVYSISGNVKVGLDFTPADLTANKAAIALKIDDRVYFGASSTPDSSGAKWYANNLGNTYITCQTPDYFTVVCGGVPTFETSDTDIFSLCANGLTFTSTGILRFAGTGQYGTGSSVATFTATNKLGGTSGGPTQWLKISLNGSPYVIPCWPQ